MKIYILTCTSVGDYTCISEIQAQNSRHKRICPYIHQATYGTDCLYRLVVSNLNLHGLSPRASYTDRATASELYRPSDRRLSAK
jgi:hypothetical protein